jgi:hypothetical protein
MKSVIAMSLTLLIGVNVFAGTTQVGSAGLDSASDEHGASPWINASTSQTLGFHTSSQLTKALDYQISMAAISSRCSKIAPVFCEDPGAIFRADPFYIKTSAVANLKSPRGNIYRMASNYGLEDRELYKADISFEVLTSQTDKTIQVNVFRDLCHNFPIKGSCETHLLESIAGTCAEGDSAQVYCSLNDNRGTIVYQNSSDLLNRSLMRSFFKAGEAITDKESCSQMIVLSRQRSSIKEPVQGINIITSFRGEFSQPLGLTMPPAVNLDYADGPDRLTDAGRILALATPNKVPTIIYSDDNARVCAEVLAEKLYEHLKRNYNRELPRVKVVGRKSYERSKPRTIELYWEHSGITW